MTGALSTILVIRQRIIARTPISILWRECCVFQIYVQTNILFRSNLLQQSNVYMNSSNPPGNNNPTDPTFIWNITADIYDDYSDFPMFQTAATIMLQGVDTIYNPPNGNSRTKNPISHSHTSNVYYPFDR